MRWFLFVLLFLQVTVNSQSIQSQIPEPKEGKATVVFFRLEEAPPLDGRRPGVKLNGQEFAKFPEETWLALSLPPATYQLKMTQKQSQFEFSTEPGKIYFIQVSQAPTGLLFRQSISFAREEQARAWIRNLKYSSIDHVHKDYRPMLLMPQATTPVSAVTFPVIKQEDRNGQSLQPVILSRPKAEYTDEARKRKIEGQVVLSVIFNADGKLKVVKIEKGLPFGLSEAAAQAAEQIQFTPASKDGKAVSIAGKLEYTFKL